MIESQRSFNFIYAEFLAIVWFYFTFRNVEFDVFSQFWIFTVRNYIIYRRHDQGIIDASGSHLVLAKYVDYNHFNFKLII